MNLRNKIQRNSNPSGRMNNMMFGLCAIADGLVRVLSIGLLHSRFMIDHAGDTARRRLDKLKREAQP